MADTAEQNSGRKRRLEEEKPVDESLGSGPQPSKPAGSTKRRRWDKDTAEDNHGSGNGAETATTAAVAPQSKSVPKMSLDALAKARKALQMQKELSAKLAKLPNIKKPPAAASAELETKASQPVLAPPPPPPPPAVVPPMVLNPNLLGAGLGMGAFPGFIPGFSMPGLDAVLRAQQAMAQQMGLNLATPTAPGGATAAGEGGASKTVKAPVLRLDAMGREVDEEGRVIEGKNRKSGPVSTLKVNINKAKKEAFRILRPDLEEDPLNSPFFDASLAADKKARSRLTRPRRHGLNFVEEGEMSRRAEGERMRNQLGEARMAEMKARQAAMAKAKEDAMDEVNPNLISVGERVVDQPKKPKDPIPDIEWWDASLLVHGSYAEDVYEDKPANIKPSRLTIYVEHPVPIEPPAEAPPPPPQPLKLTKKEQKKMRTQRRLAREKERQEMIRQGLMEPPKAKIKMSNLMRVLGAEATQDPTRMEQQVRSAAAEREQAHADRNLARKLTPAEKKEKKERKLFEDKTSLETYVSVYRLVHLEHPQTRFKVDINAQENRLSGCCVMADKLTIVAVEGGMKAIKRFSKLMLRRINWEAAVLDEDEMTENTLGSQPNSCKLVWEGAVARPSFENFQIKSFRMEAAAKKFLADHGVSHYWDLAANFPTD